MSEDTVGTIAPLQNVALLMRAMERVKAREHHLPGLVSFSGPSGWGKTMASTFVANRHNALYVETKSSWTKKALCLAILRETGLTPAKTIYEMTDQIAQFLAETEQPLIIDEFDYVVDRNMVDLVRDFYESSAGSIILVGEEQLPQKLSQFERFHGRILEWVQAQPAVAKDATHLAKHYCEGLTIKADLINKLVKLCHGSVRRICVNLNKIKDEANADGKRTVDLDWWNGREFYTGTPPARRQNVA